MNPTEMIDAEVLGAFLDESDDALASVDEGFVALESDPTDSERLNGIFRAIHTIKGNSAFFGLLRVKRLAHQMEDLLSLMREQKVQTSHQEISCLLRGLDLLKEMLRRVRQDRPEIEGHEEAALAEVVAKLAHAAAAPVDLPAWRGVWRQLQALSARTANTEFAAAVESLRSTLLAVVAPEDQPTRSLMPERPMAEPTEPAEPEPLAALEALLAPAIEDTLAPELASQVQTALELLCASPLPERAAIAALALSEYHSMMQSVGFVPLLREVLQERVAELKALEESPPAADGTARSAPTSPEPAARAASGDRKPARREKTDTARTMRVEEHRIDEFLDYVGELIIAREMFGNVGKRLRLSKEHTQLSTEYQRALAAFTQLSHNLQRSIMEVRKVPVKLILQKVPRMVRDLAEQEGKQAQATLSGGEISVDKSLVESFEAPLVHMVRNAVDHGIEPPAVREQNGKPPLGRIDVTVTETPDAILCAIRDDGGGIDAGALKAKAVKLGLLTERAASQMSQGEAFQLIFAAGLSTAPKVTEVSGRGVGMDVVKRNVAELGGRIDIQSTPGKGSLFTVHLPKAVTVQILDGFLVQVGGERLVLPLRSIHESFRPTPEQLHTVAERGECVSRRGRVFPLVRFNRLLALDCADRDATDAIVVAVEVSGGRSAGLLVDQVLGVQQVVLREVEGIDAKAQVFAGGAVLGDGRVAMVIDVDKLGALVA